MIVGLPGCHLRNDLKSKQHTISGLLKLVERLSQQADVETSAQETAEAGPLEGLGGLASWYCHGSIGSVTCFGHDKETGCRCSSSTGHVFSLVCPQEEPEINPKQVIETKAGDVPPRVPSNMTAAPSRAAAAPPSRAAAPVAAPAPVEENESKDDGPLDAVEEMWVDW